MVLDFVRLAVDGVGKFILNLKHTGLIESPPGTPVDVYVQVNHLADPEAPFAIARVRNNRPDVADHGVVVRDAPHTLDTGYTLLTDGYAGILGGGPVSLSLIFLVNLSNEIQTVTIADLDDNLYFPSVQLAPGAPPLLLPMHGLQSLNGLKWKCSTNHQVAGQILGDTPA